MNKEEKISVLDQTIDHWEWMVENPGTMKGDYPPIKHLSREKREIMMEDYANCYLCKAVPTCSLCPMFGEWESFGKKEKNLHCNHTLGCKRTAYMEWRFGDREAGAKQIVSNLKKVLEEVKNGE